MGNPDLGSTLHVPFLKREPDKAPVARIPHNQERLVIAGKAFGMLKAGSLLIRVHGNHMAKLCSLGGRGQQWD